MKKREIKDLAIILGVIIIALALIVTLISTLTPHPLPQLGPDSAVPEIIPGINDPEQLTDKIDSIKQNFSDLNQSSWDYIQQEWKNMLLKNKVFGGFNSFLKKLSPVFWTIFGVEYDLSVTFIIAVFLWIYFMLFTKEIIADLSTFSRTTAFVIGIVLAIVLGHLKFWEVISEGIKSLVDFFAGNGPWWLHLIIRIGIIIALIVAYVIFAKFGPQKKERREKMKRESEMYKGERAARRLENVADEITKEGTKERQGIFSAFKKFTKTNTGI